MHSIFTVLYSCTTSDLIQPPDIFAAVLITLYSYLKVKAPSSFFKIIQSRAKVNKIFVSMTTYCTVLDIRFNKNGTIFADMIFVGTIFVGGPGTKISQDIFRPRK